VITTHKHIRDLLKHRHSVTVNEVDRETFEVLTFPLGTLTR